MGVLIVVIPDPDFCQEFSASCHTPLGLAQIIAKLPVAWAKKLTEMSCTMKKYATHNNDVPIGLSEVTWQLDEGGFAWHIYMALEQLTVP